MPSKKVIALTFIENVVGESSKSILNKSQQTSLASFRLQLYPALIACQELGYKVEIWSLHNSHPEQLEMIRDADFCIVGKMSSNSEEKVNKFTMINLAALARIKRMNIPITIIYSDHHCEASDLVGKFYRDIMNLADSVVCPTEKLVTLLKESTPRDIKYKVIKDPWHFESMNKYTWDDSSEQLKLLWYGSASNVTYLAKLLPSMMKKLNTRRTISLTILSTKIAHTVICSALKKDLPSAKKWIFTFKIWDPSIQPKQLQDELNNAHITLIPSDPSDSSKAGVSHNRFVDAVRGGTIPIASPMSSYLELSELGLIGQNFELLIEYAEKNYASLTKQIEKNRSSKLSNHSPEYNLKVWKEWILQF